MTAPYVTHGITLALAWFAIVNAAASVGAAIVARVLATRERSSGFWFGLRLSPAIVSAVFVAAVFLPSYWRYEPADTVEGFDVTLTACAAAAIALWMLTSVRGIAAWMGAARRARIWIEDARPIGVHGGVPAFEIEAEAPMMALVGILRPRLIVTSPVATALSRDEMQASIAHEVAHWRASDNLKRLAMRSSPDFLGVIPAGRTIERRWASAAEHAADSCAAGMNPAARCALASALVKLVKLMPPLAPALAEPISTLVGGGDVTARVARLLDDRPSSVAARASGWRWTAAGVTTLAIAVSYSSWLVIVHEITETLVSSLP